MNRQLFSFIVMTLLLIAGCHRPKPSEKVECATYYISSSSGSDTYDGCAATWDGTHGPWKTLAKASGVILKPGDKLLLKCGDEWNETLTPNGSGTPEKPITISSYGNGERPYIYQQISKSETRCIHLKNVMGYRIIGLELGKAMYGIEIDTRLGYGNNQAGVRADPERSPAEIGTYATEPFKYWDYYAIEDCYFHDMVNPDFPPEAINGQDLTGWPWVVYKRVDKAIEVAAGSNHNHISQGCIFRNMTMKNCFTDRNQGVWSCNYIYESKEMGVGEENTVIDGCTFHNGYFNNIYISCVDGFEFKNSVMHYSWVKDDRHPYGNIWVLTGTPEYLYDRIPADFRAPADAHLGYPTKGIRFTGNEIGWAGDKPGKPVDGCWYDLECDQENSLISDNYMHHAMSQGILFMGTPTLKDIIFKNNIFRSVAEWHDRPYVIDSYNKNVNSSGTITDNKFIIKPGHTAYFQHSPSDRISFSETNEVIHDNDLERYFVKMPLVKEIDVQPGTRSYAFLCGTPDAVMYYTTDGSLPTEMSNRYSGPITLTRTGVINVKAFSAQLLPSITNSTIVNFRDDTGKAPVANWKPGENGHVGAVDNKKLKTITDNFTIAFWANPKGAITKPASNPEEATGTSGSVGQQYAISPYIADMTADDCAVGISVGTNGILLAEQSVGGHQPSVLFNFNDQLNGWTHIAIVYSEGKPRLYIDGVFSKDGFKSTKKKFIPASRRVVTLKAVTKGSWTMCVYSIVR